MNESIFSLEAGMRRVAPLVPLMPLLAAMVLGALGTRVLRGAAHWVTIAALAISLWAAGVLLGVTATAHEGAVHAFRTWHVYSWISPAGGTWFNVNFFIDPLAGVMLVMVCTVSLLVTIYSRDYMREHGHPERGYERFFAFLGLFVFSMCTLVLSGNFLLLYLGWEAVGLCSYLLIGFYYGRPSAAAAAKKAFLVNRIGDFGFGLGILFIYLWISPLVGSGVSPLDYEVVFAHVGQLTSGQATTIALLLFCGAVGKSAQLPLYVWLPDAMEGPTPVSALIHAATMVTAGVYMVVRCGAIFTASPIALTVVAVVGAATALFAATIAVAQYDMKRILAYSTISQLGYMFLGVGVLAADSAIFHLFTHAFFKALLFLGAGSVMHAMAGRIDVREFGGLRRVLPWTFTLFLLGSLALAGVPFLSGFFSKDEIIHAAFANGHRVLGAMALGTALLTAFYTFRMVFLAFAGPQRIPEGVHPHESGPWMLLPLAALAIGAVGAGYLGVRLQAGGFAGFLEPHGYFHHLLGPSVEPYRHAAAAHAAAAHATAAHTTGAHAGGGHEGHALMYVSAAISLVGIAAAWWLYARRRDLAESARAAMPEVHTLLHRKYYVDEINDAAIVRPLWMGGRLFEAADNRIIDGLLGVITGVPRGLGGVLRVLQDGLIRTYGLSMTAGLAAIVIIVMLVG